jgi:hypothetical protein
MIRSFVARYQISNQYIAASLSALIAPREQMYATTQGNYSTLELMREVFASALVYLEVVTLHVVHCAFVTVLQLCCSCISNVASKSSTVLQCVSFLHWASCFVV